MSLLTESFPLSVPPESSRNSEACRPSTVSAFVVSYPVTEREYISSVDLLDNMFTVPLLPFCIVWTVNVSPLETSIVSIMLFDALSWPDPCLMYPLMPIASRLFPLIANLIPGLTRISPFGELNAREQYTMYVPSSVKVISSGFVPSLWV